MVINLQMIIVDALSSCCLFLFLFLIRVFGVLGWLILSLSNPVNIVAARSSVGTCSLTLSLTPLLLYVAQLWPYVETGPTFSQFF